MPDRAMTPEEVAREVAIKLADLNFPSWQGIAARLRKHGDEVELERGEPSAAFVAVIRDALLAQAQRDAEAVEVSRKNAREGWAAAHAAVDRAIAAEQRVRELQTENERLTARIAEVEGAMFGAGVLYGYETSDGLPCWCEPNERAGRPHAKRCAELRGVLSR